MLSSVLLLPSGSIKARHRRPLDPHGQARSVSVVLSTCLAGVVTEGTSCLTRQSATVLACTPWSFNTNRRLIFYGPVWDREADKREWNKRNAAPDLLLRLWATQFNVRDFQWPAAAQRAFNASSLAGLFRFFGS